MTNPLRTWEDYELFIYSLTEKYPTMPRSNLTFTRLGASLARVSGELHFDRYPARCKIYDAVEGFRLPAKLVLLSFR